MATGRPNRTGRSEKLPAFTPLLHHVLDSPAWKSLPPLARCLYIDLDRRGGHKGARNGHVFLSVREVAEAYGVSKDTTSAAFHLLQARGFIRPTLIGSLGLEGEGRATTWTLTAWSAQNGHVATKDFLAWKPGHDFPVAKGRPPSHARKRVPPCRTPCPSRSGEAMPKGARKGRPCLSRSDVGAVLEPLPVRYRGTLKELPPRGESDAAA